MFSREDARIELGLHSDDFVFGTIGRLVRIKGHIHLLKAFHKVHNDNPNVKLLIIGEGKERALLEKYIDSHNLQQCVLLPGEIINANRFIKAFDVFVLPSLQEGFGMVLLEAMAGKIPSIASNVGGIPCVLGSEGKLVPPEEIESLSNAMKSYLLLTNEERDSLGDILYKRLQENFGIQQYREQFRALALPNKQDE